MCKRLSHEFDGNYQALFCANDAFTKFSPVDSWVVFVDEQDVPLTEVLLSAVSQLCTYYSYQIAEPVYVKIPSNSDLKVWETSMNEYLQSAEKKPMFALVTMNSKLESTVFYRKVKEIFTLSNGIPCSLVKASTLLPYDSTNSPSPHHLINAFAARFLA